MHWVDIVIVVAIVGAIFFGMARGLLMLVASTLGAVLGLFIAKQNYPSANDFLAIFYTRTPLLATISYVVVFALVWLLVVLIAATIRGGLRFTPVGALDKVGGAVLGAVLGVLLVEALLVVAGRAHDPALHASVRASQLAPAFNHVLPGLKSLIPDRFLPASA
jgi:uncharacterized membrane protein required for colicin V production